MDSVGVFHLLFGKDGLVEGHLYANACTLGKLIGFTLREQSDAVESRFSDIFCVGNHFLSKCGRHGIVIEGILLGIDQSHLHAQIQRQIVYALDISEGTQGVIIVNDLVGVAGLVVDVLFQTAQECAGLIEAGIIMTVLVHAAVGMDQTVAGQLAVAADPYIIGRIGHILDLVRGVTLNGDDHCRSILSCLYIPGYQTYMV